MQIKLFNKKILLIVFILLLSGCGNKDIIIQKEISEKQIIEQSFGASGTYTAHITEAENDGQDDGTNYTSGVIFGKEGGTSSYSGLRYMNVTIPQGATITSAELSVKAGTNFTNSILTNIYCEDVDDSTVFSSSSKPSGRTRTTDFTAWDFSTSWTALSWYDTTDFKNAVQEVINRVGWESGNSLAVIITDDGTTDSTNRYIYNYSSGLAASAEITIGYDYIAESVPLTPIIIMFE